MTEPTAPPPPAAPPPAPPYIPPPAPSYGSAATYPPAARPGMVTGAAIVLIVIGVLTALFSLLIIAGGLFVSGLGSSATNQAGAVFGAAGGVLAFVGILVLAWGVLEVVTGINVLSAKGWARVTGIVLAAIGGLFSLLGLFGGNQGGGIIFPIILLVAYAFVVWALITTGAYFARR